MVAGEKSGQIAGSHFHRAGERIWYIGGQGEASFMRSRRKVTGYSGKQAERGALAIKSQEAQAVKSFEILAEELKDPEAGDAITAWCDPKEVETPSMIFVHLKSPKIWMDGNH